MTDLARDDNIKRRMQLLSDLVPHDNAAARKRQYNSIPIDIA